MGLKSWLVGKAVNWAKPYIKAELSVDKLAGYAVEGVDWAATAATKNVDDAKLANLARGCNLAASTFANLATALDPESESGRTISEREKLPLRRNLREAVLLIVTQEQLDALVDKACVAVVERIG